MRKRVTKAMKRAIAVERKHREFLERRARHLAKVRLEARPVISPSESGPGSGTHNHITWASKKRRR